MVLLRAEHPASAVLEVMKRLLHENLAMNESRGQGFREEAAQVIYRFQPATVEAWRIENQARRRS